MKDKQVFKLLIIEDNELIVWNFQHHLNKRPKFRFDYVVCDELQNGIDELYMDNFDAVILSLSLPDSKFISTIKSIEQMSILAPVIVATSYEDENLALQAIKYGAEDYITKDKLDYDKLVSKILFARERYQKKVDLLHKSSKYQVMLSNILPSGIIDELYVSGTTESKSFECATIMFTDFISFHKTTANIEPDIVVEHLNKYFSKFDTIIRKYDIEKIKTIGDSYLCVSGIPNTNSSHAVLMLLAAIEIRNYTIEERKKFSFSELCWDIRIGINSGPLSAGIVGKSKFAYDVWGESVNVASRIESIAEPATIRISADCYELVKKFFNCRHEKKKIKDMGTISTYVVDNLKKEYCSSTESGSPGVIWVRSLVSDTV